jgi:hypothetical protein
VTAPVQPDPRTAAVVAHLSEPRLRPYLAATNGNVKEALRLYQWNIDLSGAVYETLHVFEVVLRNAMDAQLSIWNATQTDASTRRAHALDWLMDPAPLLIRLAGADIAQAANRAHAALRTGKPGGRVPGHPDVLTQLSFGTWRFLLPSNDPGRELLWNQALNAAFPHLDVPPTRLVKQVDGVYRLRNRVAHLEPLLRSGAVQDQIKAMRAVLSAINPEIENWFTSRQRGTTVLKARPYCPLSHGKANTFTTPPGRPAVRL